MLCSLLNMKEVPPVIRQVPPAIESEVTFKGKKVLSCFCSGQKTKHQSVIINPQTFPHFARVFYWELLFKTISFLPLYYQALLGVDLYHVSPVKTKFKMQISLTTLIVQNVCVCSEMSFLSCCFLMINIISPTEDEDLKPAALPFRSTPCLCIELENDDPNCTRKIKISGKN